jgi:ATF/CREB family transcription factor
MLTGPQNTTDYFSDSFRGGFPTPNESGLRTGLTPGGGGSMFPAPSPNSQALFNLQSGGATPSTLDFHRTALSAAAAANVTKFNLASSAPTSQALEQTAGPQMDRSQPQGAQPRAAQADMYSGHDVNTAANDLLQFATQGNGAARNGQFAVPTQPNHVNNNMHMSNQSADTSPTQARRGTKSSIATSIGSMDTAEQSESGQSEQAKPATRSRGKRAANSKTNVNNRRKADETPSKAPANKRQKGGNGAVQPLVDEDDDSEEDISPKPEDGLNANGKKMTDEEKRKNFLERNR